MDRQNSPAFRVAGPSMREAGFAVLPARGKAPIMSGFNKWRWAPGLAVVEKWADCHPDANVVYVPGLSRTKRGNPIINLDGDDEEACGRIVEDFGDTPGKIRTRRGRHHLYEDPGGQVSKMLGKLSNLRKLGINADVKHGQLGAGISVAPPSIHEKEPGFRYQWVGCDETVINHLPTLNPKAIQALLDNYSEGEQNDPQCNYTAPPPAPPAPPADPDGQLTHNGSRGLGLNRCLCSYAGDIWSFDDALAVAREYNGELVAAGLPPLDDGELYKRTEQFWRDLNAGKVQRWRNGRAHGSADGDEIRELVAMDQNGPDAFALLMLLRAEHGARCARGETFAIMSKAMSEQRVLGKWSARKYREARDLLLAAGKIELVKEATPRQPAEYRFVKSKGAGG